jgi:hypothetical protein
VNTLEARVLKQRNGSRYTANRRAAFPKNAVNDIIKQNIQANVLNVSDTSVDGTLVVVVAEDVEVVIAATFVCCLCCFEVQRFKALVSINI